MLYVVTKDQAPDPPHLISYHGYVVMLADGTVINPAGISLLSLDEVAAFIGGHSGCRVSRFDLIHHNTQAVVAEGRTCIDYWTSGVVTTA